MLWTDIRTETDNTTTIVATRLKYDPTSKVNVQQQMLALACMSMPVKLSAIFRDKTHTHTRLKLE